MLITVDRIAYSNRKRALEIVVGSQVLPIPFSLLDIQPDARDPIVRAFVDRSGASDAIKYVLKSRRVGSVTLETIFEYNSPPIASRERLLDKLRMEARHRMKSTALSVREISRRLPTSPTQIYRLLDHKHQCESLDQLVALLQVLDCDVDVIFYSANPSTGSDISRPSSRRGT